MYFFLTKDVDVYALTIDIPNIFFFKTMSYTYYINIEAEFVTTPTIATERHMNHRDQQNTPPKLSNNLTTRSNPPH
jgi:hypothetical protein